VMLRRQKDEFEAETQTTASDWEKRCYACYWWRLWLMWGPWRDNLLCVVLWCSLYTGIKYRSLNHELMSGHAFVSYKACMCWIMSFCKLWLQSKNSVVVLLTRWEKCELGEWNNLLRGDVSWNIVPALSVDILWAVCNVR
jgi:hypothetical protein